MITIETAVYAILGGLVPALLWLWFFLREDKKRPEPLPYIILAFVAGAITVFLVLPAERFVQVYFEGTFLIFLWALIEESFKYFAAAIVILWRKVVNEPIDAVIYMITIALGFSAFENTLFLLNPLLLGEVLDGILTGNLRFIGATLLHTLSSGVIGIAMAFSFYRKEQIKISYLLAGIILATVLHTTFNFFIMSSNGERTFLAFSLVWIGIIALIFTFEKIKRLPIRRLFKRNR